MPTGIIGGIIGGVGNIIGSKTAADAQRDAAETAAGTQLQMYMQNREDLAPWREQGRDALTVISNLNFRGADPLESGIYSRYLASARPHYDAALSSIEQIPGAVQGYLDRADTYNDRLTGISDEIGGLRPRYQELENYLTGLRPQTEVGPSGMPRWAEAADANFKGSKAYQWAKEEAMRGAGAKLAQSGQFGGGGAYRELARTAAGVASQDYDRFRNALLSLDPVGRQAALTMNAGSLLDAERGALTGQLTANQNLVQNMLNQGKLKSSSLVDYATGQTNYGNQLIDEAKQIGGWYADQYNRLANLAGVGQTATQNTATLGQQTANNVAQTQLMAGQADASGILRGTNAFSNTVGQIFNPTQPSPYSSSGNTSNTSNNWGWQTPSWIPSWGSSQSTNPAVSDYSGGYSNQSDLGF